MIITYEGVEFFKVSYGDVTLAFNPVSKRSSHKASRFGADVVLVSAHHEDFNGVDTVTFGDRNPFAITGPGEYELKGIVVRGFAGETAYGGEQMSNSIYLVELEGMTLCFLGALNQKELPKDANETLDTVDILFLPIGGEGVLSPSDAYKLAVAIEPKVIIPMHYGAVGVKNALQSFLKEAGATEAQTVDKLTLKKKDLEGKEGDIVVLRSQA